MITRDEIKARLLNGVGFVDDASGCWSWKTPTNRDRGQINIGGKTHLACRVTWEVYRGEIPDGMHVLHACDNPRCVNPDHLWLGTHADNMADKKAKGRAHRLPGEKHPMAKITDDDAREIYRLVVALGQSSPIVAEMFGVNYHTVRKIATGKQWSSATGALRK